MMTDQLDLNSNPFDEFLPENPFDDLATPADNEARAMPAQEVSEPTVAEPQMSAYEPGLIQRGLELIFPPNRAAASNELAAREIAQERNIPLDQVYEDVGGSRPMSDPEGRSGLNAVADGYAKTDQAIDQSQKAATGRDRGFVRRVGEAIPNGFDNMLDSLSMAKFVVSGGDKEALADEVLEKVQRMNDQQAIRPASEAGVYGGIQSVNASSGFKETIASGVRAAAEFFGNPSDAAVISAEQAANSLPGIVGGGVAALPGGLVGGVPGAIVAGRTGMAAGTGAVELGAEFEQALLEGIDFNLSKEDIKREIIKKLEDPAFISAARERAVKKGVTVAAVDQVFLTLGGKLALRKGAKNKALAVGLDMTGESSGEAASQVVARGEVDAGDVLLEGLASAPTSAIDVGVGAAMERGSQKKTQSAEPGPSESSEPSAEPPVLTEQVDLDTNPFAEFSYDNGVDFEKVAPAPVEPAPSKPIGNEVEFEKVEPAEVQGQGLQLMGSDVVEFERPETIDRTEELAQGIDKEIKAHVDNQRAQRMPKNFQDARLLNPAYRQELEASVKSLDDQHKNINSSVVNPEKDDLFTAMAKLGGISKEELSQDGFDKPDMAVRVGVKPVFTKSGKSVDDMAEALVQDGYIRERDPEELKEAIREQLAGNERYSLTHIDTILENQTLINSKSLGASPSVAKKALQKALKGEKLSEKQIKIVNDALTLVNAERSEQVQDLQSLRKEKNEYRRQVLQVQELAFDNLETAESVKRRNLSMDWDAQDYFELADSEIDSIDDTLTYDERVEVSAIYDALTSGVSEAVINELELQYPDRDQFIAAIYRTIGQGNNEQAENRAEPQQGVEGRESAEGQERQGRDSSGRTDPVQESESGETELLTSYTEEQLQQKESKQKASEKARQLEQEQRDAKEQADKAVDDFQLTGSDRTADVNPNQSDIFDSATNQPIQATGNRQGNTETYEFPDGSIQSRSDDEVRSSKVTSDTNINFSAIVRDKNGSPYHVNSKRAGKMNIAPFENGKPSIHSGNPTVTDLSEYTFNDEWWYDGEIVQGMPESSSKDTPNPEPTEAQKEAGNYKVGRIKVHGLNISIENPKDSKRKGTSPDGTQWENTMGAHYGYILKTEGADGDHVDVFVGEQPESEKVWIVDQVNEDGSFDEHKVLLGFKNKLLARKAYKQSYDAGWKVGPITAMNIDEFKTWLEGDTTKPLSKDTFKSAKKAPSNDGVSDSNVGIDVPESVQDTPVAEIKDISEKAFVVVGDTKPHKERIKGLGAKWNIKHKGWMFPKSRQAEIETELAELLGDNKSSEKDKKTSSSDAPSKIPAPDWWAYRTGAERHSVLHGAGIKGNASTKWDSLTAEQQHSLNSQWGEQPGLANVSNEPDGEPKQLLEKSERKKNGESKLVKDFIDGKTEEPPTTEQVDEELGNTPKTKLDRVADGIDSEIDAVAAELADLLKKQSGQMNSGVDPAILALGAKLGALYVSKGFVKFAQYSQAVIKKLKEMGVNPEQVKPMLKEFYGATQAQVSDELFDQMDDMRTVRKFDLDSLNIEDEPAETPSTKGSLNDFLYDRLESISDNRALKRVVAEYHGVTTKDVTDAQMKQAQEAMEFALVKKARAIVAESKSDKTTYNALLDLYKMQPNLNVRSSTSMENQAYSTPAPIAFLASRMAGIDQTKDVYEPTAGNGMLLIGANPETTVANELEGLRVSQLKELGFKVTQKDATTNNPGKASYDAAIMNPPFGKLRNEDGSIKPVNYDDYILKSIDHLITAKALEAIKDDGKATIIIGADRKAGEIGASDRVFFNWLYSHYNVTDHFEIDGKLYNRQGAGWPIRVITVNGRVESDTLAPKSGAVERLSTWEEIYEHYNNGLDSRGRFVGNRTKSIGGSGIEGTNTESRVVKDASTGQNSQSAKAGDKGFNPQNLGDSTGLAGGVGTQSGSQRSSSRPSNDRQRAPSVEQGKTETLSDQPEGLATAKESNTGELRSGSERQPKPVSSQFQSSYQAKSGGFNEAVLTPTNMAEPIQQALTDIEKQVGPLDDYVMDKLGYTSKDDMYSAFMGLQIDAVAAAIFNFEQKEKGLIIADQTGVGKGRQAAAMIRYALRHDKLPIFVTVTENLFTDMYDDLADIGSNNVRPFILNADSSIKHKGKHLFANKKSGHKVLISELAREKRIPDDRNAVFLTYSQLGMDNEQRKFIDANKENAIFILDESHNAAGDQEKIKKVKGVTVKQRTGAGFINDVIAGKPVVYLSATFAKRPDNMPVYYRTDLIDAVDNVSQLVDAVAAGGVPLQSAMSGMLARTGQLLRRERSFEGIAIPVVLDTQNKQIHQKIADQVTKGLRAIVSADFLFHNVFFEWYKEQAEQVGASLGGAGNKVSQTIDHNNFNSVAHNFVKQLLLALKAEGAANKAIQAYNEGKKPVIALEITMGSFLKEFVDDSGLKVGDTIDADYRDVLLRALERSRRITIKNPNGQNEKVQISVSQLDPQTQQAYKNAEKVIRSLQLDGFPISPIDFMRNELTKAGINVAELTGRDLMVDYSGDKPVLGKRPQEESNKRNMVDKFNTGQLDALIINKSGSTGLSIHASEKFKDQKPRHMIVAQPMGDVNVLVQMLGRINRTGQIELPTYELMGLDIPAEKRPLAANSRKMKSLNANTSANEDSDTSLNVPDMFNKYGDRVVAAFLGENPDVRRMANISSAVQEETDAYEGLAMQFTGRMALFSVKQQEEIYAQIEPAYNDLIEYLDKTNQNDLKATTLDTDAKILESKIVYEGKKPGTIFGGNTTMHKVDIKQQGKPPTSRDVQKALDDALKGGQTPGGLSRQTIESKHDDEKAMLANLDERILKAEKELREYESKGSKIKNEKLLGLQNTVKEISDLKAKYTAHVQKAKDLIERFKIGQKFHLDLGDDEVVGTVVGIRDSHKKGMGDPYAGSKIKVQFLVNSGIRSIDVPLKKLAPDGEIVKGASSESIESIYDDRSESVSAREQRYIATGNLIAGSAHLKGGRIVNFTDDKGNTHQGIMMPKKYGKEGEFDSADETNNFAIRDAKIAAKFLKLNEEKIEFSGGIFSESQGVRVTRDRNGWNVQVKKANKDAVARSVKFDDGIRKLIGDFYGSGQTMKAHFDDSKIEQVVQRLLEITPLYALPSMRDAWVAVGGSDKAMAVKSFDETEAESTRSRFSLDSRNRTGSAADDGSPISEADANRVINQITFDWRSGRENVVLVGTFDELPSDIKQDAESQDAGESDVKGVFKHGKVYVVRENHSSESDLEETIFHEAYGHYGLKQMFGQNIDKQMNSLFMSIGGSKGLNRIAQKYGIDLSEYARGMGSHNGFDHDTRNGLIVEELLAHLAEDQKPSISRKAKELIGQLREWLRKKGFALLKNYNDTDLMFLLKKAKAHAKASEASADLGQARFIRAEAVYDKFLESRGATFRRGKRKPTEHDERMKQFFDGIGHQPIDRMFRLPFDALGVIDSHGRLKGSQKLQGAVKDIITNWKPHSDRFEWLGNIIEAARHGLIDRYKLSEEYKQTFREAEALGRGIDMQALDILKTLEENGVSGPEAAVLQKMLTGEPLPDHHLSSLAAPILRAIDDLGLAAVEYGVITREQFERNRGSYLHRSYMKHEGEFSSVGKWLMNKQRNRARKIQGKSAKGRGIEVKVSMDRLLKHVPQEWFGIQNISQKPDMRALNGRKFVILDNPGMDTSQTDTFDGMEANDKEKTVERIYWPTDMDRPARFDGYRERGTFEIRGKRKGKVVLWRDYTKRERENMGEILDARYNIAKTFQVISHDLAMGKFFQDVSMNPEWFREDLPPGALSLSAAEASKLRSLSKTDWVQVPDVVVKQSAGTKQWGALSGGYVRAEIWRDLVELDKMQNAGMWRKILTQWKINKTARSPVTHMNNVLSNVIFMDLADVRVSDLVSGITSYLKKDEHRKAAEQHGAFEGTFANEELRRKVMEPILDELARQNLEAGTDTESTLHAMSKVSLTIWNTIKRLDNAMISAYQAEDELFRMATYMRRVSLGDSPEVAARIAREQFLDYDIRAPWINAARRTVLPFISYTYRAVPVLAKAITERPWKLAKYVTLAHIAIALSYAIEPGDEDEEYRTMREDQQGPTWLGGTPRMLRLPMRDEHGNPMFIDIRRWIPAGDVFDMNQGSSAIAVPAWLQFGGPLMIAAELALNKQGFTGREITSDVDTDLEATAKTMDYLYKSWMPSAAYIPGSYYWEKIGTAYSGGRDILGRPYSFPQAMLSSIGIKVQPHDVQLGYAFRSRDLAAQARLISGDVRRAQMDLDRNIISKAEYNKIISRSRKKIMLLEEQQKELAGR